MQSRLSPVSLKTALRKSRVLAVSLLLLLILLIPQDAVSQQLEVRTVRSSDSLIFVDCRITSLDKERLLGALDRGDTVQIGLRFRGEGPGLLEAGAAPLSGLHQRARWDRIEKLYVIERDGVKSYYLHKDALLSELLFFRDIPLRQREDGGSGTLIQGEIRWRILNPPLNILSPFLPGLRSRTEWTELPGGAAP